MAETDIIARLRLSAKAFTGEFADALDIVDKKAKSTGEQVSAAFGQQIGGSIRNATAQVPLFGSALAGLTGPVALAAGGIGVLAAGIIGAVKVTEDYEKATRQLDAVLKASGNTTGYSANQLKDYAEQLETTFAIGAEEFLKAEQVLASFEGVAGSTFKRAIADAADLAAVYGGDLSSNAEKLGVVLQNLAAGNVEGLARSFKFLGTETLDNIKNLAELGRTADAQTALLDALERKVGGAGGAAGGGLAGAFTRLKDAMSDAGREAVQSTGYFAALVGGLDWFTKKITEAKQRAADRDMSLLALGTNPNDSGRFSNGDDSVAKAAADAAYKAAQSNEKSTAAAVKHVAAAKETVKAHTELGKLADIQADRFQSVAASLTAAAAAGPELDAIGKKWLTAVADAAGAANDAADEMKRKSQEDYRYLSDSFYDVFSGKSGDIWGKFKELGARTLAELAAQFVLTGKIDVGGTSAGGLFGQLGGMGGSSGIGGSALTGAATGAAVGGAVGGNSAVSAGFGVAGGVLGGAIGGPIGAAIGSALAGALGGLITKAKDPYSDTRLSIGAGGVLAGSTVARGSTAAPALIASVSGGLAALAQELGGSVASGVGLGSIGTNKNSFYYNASGGGFKAAGTQTYATAEAAAGAAIADAVAKHAITGLSKEVQAILDGDGDLNSKIAKAKELSAALTKADAAFVQTSSTLTDFMTSLTIGSGSPLGLAEQQANAKAAYEAARAKIGTAGFDAGQFVSSGRSYLDVLRQTEGGTSGFFDVFNQVRADTTRAGTGVSAISGTDAVASQTAAATTSTAQTVAQLLDATLTTNDLLRAQLARVGASASGGQSSSGYVRKAV